MGIGGAAILLLFNELRGSKKTFSGFDYANKGGL
jgi:hypothetical protein